MVAWLRSMHFDPFCAWLYRNGFDWQDPRKKGPNEVTAMLEACREGQLWMCHWLFENGAAEDIRVKDTNGWTPMMTACDAGHLGVAKWLFEAGAAEDIRTRDETWWTPMLMACATGHLEVAQWLFEAGAAEDIRSQDDMRNTPMDFASSGGHLEVVRWLSEVGVDIRTKGGLLRDTPMKNACEGGHLLMAQWLFEAGAAGDIRIADASGYTPMLAAIYGGHLDVMQWLFKVGAAGDILTENSRGVTPMLEACRFGQNKAWRRDFPEVVVWLLLRGAVSDARGRFERAVSLRNMPSESRPAVRTLLRALLDAYATSACAVLPAATCVLAATGRPLHHSRYCLRSAQRKRRRSSSPPPPLPSPSPLALLQGHGPTLLRELADFAGVHYGREVRALRAAANALA